MKTGKFSSKRFLRSAVLSIVVVALVFATSGTAFGKAPGTRKASFTKGASANYALQMGGGK